MTFRIAEISDLQEMQKLYVDTIISVCAKDYNEMQINAWIAGVNNTERWIDVINNQFVLMAIIEDQIAGFGTLKNGNYIDFFYIHKDFQRQGIADKILSELERKAKEANTKVLSSDVSITAKPFFEKNGFVTKAEQRNVRLDNELINYKMQKEIRAQEK